MGTMSATAAPAPSDRSDFRTVTTGGAAVGVLTAVAVVAFLAASRLLPDVRGGVESLIVLAAGAVIAVTVVRLAGMRVALPVLTGGAFTLTLAALALVALARKR